MPLFFRGGNETISVHHTKMADDGELDTVKLISADGHEFVVDRKAAMVSGTIKSMLSGPGK